MGWDVVQMTKYKKTASLDKNNKRNKKVGFHPTIFRHGIAGASSALLIWLNQIVLLQMI
jgi:uncharacterized alpha/beta hydrolase family protein